MQPAECATRNDLTAPLVRSRQHNEQLALGGVADPIEAAQLTPERLAEIGQRMRWEVLAVCLRQLLHLVEAHEQTAERGALTTRSVDLLVQSRDKLYGRKAFVRARRGASCSLEIVGSHAHVF
jgi:hypothetical protein